MPITLHLGVIDIPYAQAPKKYRRKDKVETGTQTTGDVAGWLEDYYHVMEHFFELHGDDVILPALEDALQGAVDDLLAATLAAGETTSSGGVLVESNVGALNPNVFGTAEGKIDDAFRKMLDSKELDGLGYPGIPTKAAERGVDHRKKRPYVKRAPRPSFLDTGLYSASFKSWVDNG